MKKILILIIIIIGSSNQVQSQIKKSELITNNLQFNAEELLLQSNANLFLVGEVIFYKAFNFVKNSKLLSSTSKIIYVELIDSSGDIIFKHKHKLKRGTTYGDFFIPSNLKTNNYKLIAYSNWSKNNLSNPYYEQNIYILNPYSTATASTANNNKDNPIIEISKSNTITEFKNDNSFFSTNKKSYSTREKVILSVSNITEDLTKGGYSLSVRKMDSINVFDQNNKKLNNTESDIFFLPEVRGEIISGKIVPRNSALNFPIRNISVSLSIPGKDFIFKSVKTNNDGYFFFNLHENYSSKEANIQIINQDRANYDIVMDTFEFNHYKNLSFSKLKLDSKIEAWLKQRSLFSQIENAYYGIKIDSTINRKTDRPFYHPIAKVYLLDEFTRFKTIRETFIEIIEDAAVTDVNDNPNFKIINYGNTSTTNALTNLKPLVLFDGLLIQDNRDIIEYSANNIKSISIITKPYIYGSNVYSGVISFKSKKEDFKALSNPNTFNNIEVLRPQFDKIYYQPNYEKNKSLNRIPDYRNQLLWNPSVALNNDSQWAFFTSDNVGHYEITFEGYTHTGKHILEKQYFHVVD